MEGTYEMTPEFTNYDCCHWCEIDQTHFNRTKSVSFGCCGYKKQNQSAINPNAPHECYAVVDNYPTRLDYGTFIIPPGAYIEDRIAA